MIEKFCAGLTSAMQPMLRPRSLSEPPLSPPTAVRDSLDRETTLPAQGGEPVLDGQPVSAGQDVATDAAEPAPAAPLGDAAAAPEAVPEASAVPDSTATATAAPQDQPAAQPEQPAVGEQQPVAEQQPVDAAAMAAAQAQAAATASALTQNAGALEQTLQIPGTMVGKLIGKQGETIKGLQYSTNTRIQVRLVGLRLTLTTGTYIMLLICASHVQAGNFPAVWRSCTVI